MIFGIFIIRNQYITIYNLNFIAPLKKMTKIALVTGVFGQDGSFLAKLLLKKKYKVVGTYNKSKNLYDRF